MRVLFTFLIITTIGCVSSRQMQLENNKVEVLKDIHWIEVEDYSDADSIRLNFINRSAESKYIFTSYFAHRNPINQYLLRYDKSTDQLVYSFLPLVNILRTHTTDALLITDNYIFERGQSKWHFFEIPPNSKYKFVLSAEDICGMFRDVTLFNTFDFDIQGKNQIDRLEISKRDKFSLQFAFYNNVEYLDVLGGEYHERENYHAQKYQFRVVESACLCF